MGRHCPAVIGDEIRAVRAFGDDRMPALGDMGEKPVGGLEQFDSPP